MDVREVTAAEYGAYFTGRTHIFNSTAFAALNEHKARRVSYLLIGDDKVRFGIIIGDGRSPFSAPFGALDYNRQQDLRLVDDALAALKRHAGAPLTITLPPPFYDEAMLTLVANALLRQGRLMHADINYHFVTADINAYDSVLDTNGKNKLRQAVHHLGADTGAHLTAVGAARAYDVIQRNRRQQGYPLRMTLDEVMRTAEVIPADFFVLVDEGHDIAAAQVFHVARGIVQVVYWGDLREHSHLRPMNYLAYSLFKHYHEAGIDIVDVGPSTQQGVPNYGLCTFKKSIGCRPSLKYSFVL